MLYRLDPYGIIACREEWIKWFRDTNRRCPDQKPFSWDEELKAGRLVPIKESSLCKHLLVSR